tara:strand:- start:771 stop:1502 length:732 start_codon:yes stop_codon:yes gene_type:complete
MATSSDWDKAEDKEYSFKPFRVPKYQIKFKNANRLSDIDGMVWYTPAALYAWGQFTDTQLSDIVMRKDVQVFWYKFDKPVFKNFGTGWDNLLWAAKEEDWSTLVNSILEVVQFDIEEKLLYQYAMQKISILDPLSVDKERIVTSTTPEVDVNVFAVMSNTGQMAIDLKAKQKKGSVPGMSLFKPDPLHVKAANMLFRKEKLSQDAAFAEYKSIMQKLANASYKTSSQEKWESGVKGKKLGDNR